MSRFSALANEIEKHGDDWTTWLRDDPQGRQVRPFLLALISDLTRQSRDLGRTVDRVRGRVRHIVDIIRTQKSFGGTTVERTRVPVRHTIEDAVKVLGDSLANRGIAIEVDCARAPEHILVQESRFHQMLVNLLKNAMESIVEQVARHPEDVAAMQPRVRLAVYREDDHLVIDVIDNGIGIDESQFRVMFNAGYTTKSTGTGLGLHSAANFVIGSGGSIEPLSGGVGRGATMRVKLRIIERTDAA